VCPFLQDDCSICIGPMPEGDTLVQLQCGHFFHKDCLAPWLKRSTYCPVCKAMAKESLSDAQLGTRAALNAHVGVGCRKLARGIPRGPR